MKFKIIFTLSILVISSVNSMNKDSLRSILIADKREANLLNKENFCDSDDENDNDNNINGYKLILRNISNSNDYKSRCILKKVKSQFDSDGGGRASCGYHALKNGILIAKAILDNKDIDKALFDSAIISSKFETPTSCWRNHIINLRANEYAKDSIQSYLEKKLSKDAKIISAQELPILSNLLTNISTTLATKNYIDDNAITRNYKIASEVIYNTMDAIIKQRAIDEPNNKFYPSVTLAKLMQYFPNLDDLAFSIKNGSVINNGTKTSVKMWNEKIADRKPNENEMPGEWLSSNELKSIVQHEFTIKGLFDKYKANDIPIFFIDNANAQFNLENNLKDLITKIQAIESNVLAVFILYLPAHWVTCVLYKEANQKPRYILADSAGNDIRRDATINNLIKNLETANKIEEITGNNENQNNNEYFSSISTIKDEDLPSIEMLCNDQIPEAIQYLLAPAAKNPHKVKLSNWLVINGPSGTGKSTLATIVARRLGREIIYTNGSMRTKYQGSTKELLDKLFSHAKSKKKPVAIIIDEIEAAAHNIGDNSTSNEDLRSGKALLGVIDTYLHDPDILVLCTSNYAHMFERSFRNRVLTINISAPNYSCREKMIRYYLEKAKVDYKNQKAPTWVTPEFIGVLATATNGLTGRSIEAIINRSIAYYDKGITPKNVDYKFTFNISDVRNRPITSILLCGPLWIGNTFGLGKLISLLDSPLSKHLCTQFRQEKSNLAGS